MKLDEYAVVRSGLVLSRKESKEPTDFRYDLLTLRALPPEGVIETGELETFYAKEPLNSEYLTRNGDLIIRLTMPYTAVLITKNEENIVVSSNFAIIRCRANSTLLPEYLFWYLNTPRSKQRIYESTTGNMLCAVKPRYFADMEIEVPSSEQQLKTAALDRLGRREARLLRRLADEKEKYIRLVTESMQHQSKEILK